MDPGPDRPGDSPDRRACRPDPAPQQPYGNVNDTAFGAKCDWLPHLDRQLISPMELLQVSGCQPYQLTQQFMNFGTYDAMAMSYGWVPFNHRAPWFNQSTRLYRVF